MTFIPQPTLILLSHSPHHPLTQAGFRYAKVFCETVFHEALPCEKMSSETGGNQSNQLTKAEKSSVPLKVFLYADAVHLANRINWQPADQPNPTADWQQLAEQYGLTLQACVSAALARGVTDVDNGKRHALAGDNLATGFELVGLGELAMHSHAGFKVIQF